MSRDGWEWRANWFVHKTIKDLDNRKYCSKSDYCFFINVRKRNMSPVISKAYYYRLDVYYSRDRPSANKPRLVWKNTVWKNSVWKDTVWKNTVWKIQFGKVQLGKIQFKCLKGHKSLGSLLQGVSRLVGRWIGFLVRSCRLITLIKCLLGSRDTGAVEICMYQ